MNRKLWMAAMAAVALGAAGCGDDEEGGDNNGGNNQPQLNPAECQPAAEYTALSAAGFQAHSATLAQVADVIGEFNATVTAPADANANATDALNAYQDDSVNLDTQVSQVEEGAALDAEIRASIEQLRVVASAEAATRENLARLARQRVEKFGTHRFLRRAVLARLRQPSRANYDAAFGLLGTGTNVAATRAGLAAVAVGRDTNQTPQGGQPTTRLANDLFDLITRGRCILDRALTNRNAETMGLNDEPAYAQLVTAIDEHLELIFGYSLGHELDDIMKREAIRLRDTPTAPPAVANNVTYVEAEGFFVELEPLLLAQPEGSPKRNLALTLRERINAVNQARAANGPLSTDWVVPFDAAGLLDQLEAAYGITVLD